MLAPQEHTMLSGTSAVGMHKLPALFDFIVTVIPEHMTLIVCVVTPGRPRWWLQHPSQPLHTPLPEDPSEFQIPRGSSPNDGANRIKV